MVSYEEWLRRQQVPTGGDGRDEFEGILSPTGPVGSGLDPVESRILGQFGKSAAKNVLPGLLAFGEISPTGVMSAAGDAYFSGLGVGLDPQTKGEAVIGRGVQGLGKLLAGGVGMVNPAAGLMLGLATTPLADAFMDVTGLRSYDTARDVLEDQLGEISGRRAYADAGAADIEDKSLLDQGSFKLASDLARSQSLIGGPERRESFAKQQRFYQTLADKINESMYGEGGATNVSKYGIGAYTPGNERPSGDGGGNGFGGGGGFGDRTSSPGGMGGV